MFGERLARSSILEPCVRRSSESANGMERTTTAVFGEMDDPNSNNRFPPNLVGNSPSSRQMTDTSPRIVGRSPLPSPALLALGSTKLDPIPEHEHHDPSHLGAGQTATSHDPPVLVLPPSYSGSTTSLGSGSLGSGAGGGEDKDEMHEVDGDTIGPGPLDNTVEGRDPVTPEQVLEGRRKGRRRMSAVSAGLDKIRSLIGKGKTVERPLVPDSTGGTSSRRSSVSSLGGVEWKNDGSPVLVPESSLNGMVLRKDENVLKLTKLEPLSSPLLSSILNRPPNARSPTPPPNIAIDTTVMGVALDPSTTPTPDGFRKSSVSDTQRGNVPAPSLASDLPEWDNPMSDLTPTTSRMTPCTPTPRNQLFMSALGPTANPGSPVPLPTAFPIQQSRRSSLTSPAVLKTRSFDQEAQNLMLNALQRGSGAHEHRHLSLSRSSTKDSTMTGGSKPGVGGALAALGFKTAAAVGATETVKKSNINVLHPSEPVGASAHAPGLSLTAPTPMVEQDESAANSGSGYFGSKKSKGRSRASRSANKEEKYRRSLSPFFKGRRSLSRGNASDKRDPSPPVGALSDAGESDGESVVSNSTNRYRPQATAFSLSRRKNDSEDDEDDADQGSDEGDFETDTEYDDVALSHEVVGPDGWVEDVFDPLTEENTKANAVYYEGDAAGLGGEGVLEDEEGHEIEVEVDALGEGGSFSSSLETTLIASSGPNVVIPPEPLFAQPTMRRPATPPPADGPGLAGIVHKEKKKPSPLPLTTSRPEFGRNRCTVKLTQGDPDAALEQSGNRLRSYVVLSDLSAEAGYAIEWCIG